MNTEIPTNLSAPAVFIGWQEGFGKIPGFALFNLTAQVGDHPAGSTVSYQTLEKYGYAPSSAPLRDAA